MSKYTIDDYYNFISEEASSSRRSFLDGYYQKALKLETNFEPAILGLNRLDKLQSR